MIAWRTTILAWVIMACWTLGGCGSWEPQGLFTEAAMPCTQVCSASPIPGACDAPDCASIPFRTFSGDTMVEGVVVISPSRSQASMRWVLRDEQYSFQSGSLTIRSPVVPVRTIRVLAATNSDIVTGSGSVWSRPPPALQQQIETMLAH